MERTVIIGTPTYDGKLDARYVDSLVNTIKLAPPEIKVQPIFLPGDAIIQKARNDIVKIVINATEQVEISDLVFIDADIFWNPTDFFRLLNHPVETDPEPEIEIGALSAALNTLADTVSDAVAEVIDNPWQLVLPIVVEDSPAQSVKSSSVATQNISPVQSANVSNFTTPRVSVADSEEERAIALAIEDEEIARAEVEAEMKEEEAERIRLIELEEEDETEEDDETEEKGET